MKILGLDLSTHSGVAVLEDGKILAATTIDAPKEYVSVIGRGITLAEDISDYFAGVDFAVIEDYIYPRGKMAQFSMHTLKDLIVMGTMVRHALVQARIPYVEVSPTSVKKFAAGDGSATKEFMLLNVYKRWGVECKDNNAADAVALAYFGEVLVTGNQQIQGFSVVKDWRKKAKFTPNAYTKLAAIFK